jgi:hypothetical protein
LHREQRRSAVGFDDDDDDAVFPFLLLSVGRVVEPQHAQQLCVASMIIDLFDEQAEAGRKGAADGMPTPAGCRCKFAQD